MKNISRRAAITTAAAAIATPALATAPAGQGDEKIIDLYSQLVAGVIDCNLVNRDMTDDEFNKHVDCLTDIENQIYATPAHTVAGLAVKAGLSVDELVLRDGPQSTLEKAAVSLMEDLERLTGIEPMPKVYRRIAAMKKKMTCTVSACGVM